jgi:hypothetical protein
LERALKYFAESVANRNSQSFNAIKCPNWASFKSGNCDASDTSFMGFNVDER